MRKQTIQLKLPFPGPLALDSTMYCKSSRRRGRIWEGGKSCSRKYTLLSHRKKVVKLSLFTDKKKDVSTSL